MLVTAMALEGTSAVSLDEPQPVVTSVPQLSADLPKQTKHSPTKSKKRTSTPSRTTSQTKSTKLSPLAPGTYELAPSAVLTYEQNAISLTDTEFEEMWKMFPPPAPNPRNPKTNLLRLQMAFGVTYTFSGQTSPNLGPVDAVTTPSLVQRAAKDARKRASAAGHDEGLYTFVHCNGYPFGKSGLMYHQDDESFIVKRLPIYSYTFILQADPKGLHHRDFCVSTTKHNRDMVARIETGNGDLVIMDGTFQEALFHGVNKTTNQKASQLRRINITVRPLAPVEPPSNADECV